MLLILTIFPTLVSASVSSLAKIGNNFYDTLEEAIDNASNIDTIILTSDVILKNSISINKTVNIDLNGNDITAPTKVFLVQGGVLNLTGKGTIKEEKPDYGAIMIKGSSNSFDKNYSMVNIGKDVTLEGWSGIFINHDSSKAYGVVVNLDGKVNAINDINEGTGIGVYVNGKIEHQNNPPVINITDNARITSTGNGIYIAGYSIFNIKKAHISGDESAIGIKAGILNIDGATLTCNGKEKIPTEGYNNGIKPTGTTIQIESNNGYAGNMELNLKSGTFTSKNSHVIYEYIGRGTNSLVNSIKITGGTFKSNSTKDVFLFSDSFKTKHNNFITGGTYSSNPSIYLQAEYTTALENGLYKVIRSTMKELDSQKSPKKTTNNIIKILFPLALTGLLTIIAYFNRRKILNLFK